MTEQWRPVPGSEDRYEVSSCGRVRSLDTVLEVPSRWGGTRPMPITGRVLRQWTDGNGYALVYLTNRKAVNVHRLVALAFLGGADGRHVNHIDGDKANNRPANLEWVTQAENMAHARQTGLLNDSKPLIATPKRGGAPIRFAGVNAAARAMGAARNANILSAAKGRIPSAYGYRWEYEKAA